jgi:hypothetical protein
MASSPSSAVMEGIPRLIFSSIIGGIIVGNSFTLVRFQIGPNCSLEAELVQVAAI